MELMGVSMTREQTSFAYVSSCCMSSLNRRRVVPLYTRVTPVGPQRPTPVHTRISVGLSLFLTYNTSLYTNAGLQLQV